MVREGNTRFGEIDVERINIIDGDGKVRMAISGSTRSPGWVIGGKVIPGRPKFAGIIFYNDDGVECGGLIFGNDGMSLTMDQKDQDQILGLQYEETPAGRWYGLTVWDRPDTPLAEVVDRLEAMHALPDGPEKAAARKQIMRDFPSPERLYVGKRPDGATVVQVSDSRGRSRIRLGIDAGDQPVLEVLDEDGKVVWSLSGSGSSSKADGLGGAG